MGGGSSIEGCEELARLFRQEQADAPAWERADTVVRASELRRRLEDLGVRVTPDVAGALMAAAVVLASRNDEWGGDYRDALCDMAAIGLELFDG